MGPFQGLRALLLLGALLPVSFAAAAQSPPGLPGAGTLQERAYTSPIWYRP